MEFNETKELTNQKTKERSSVHSFIRSFVPWSHAFLMAGAVLFFLVTSYFSFQLQNPYSSPDETAQAYFIQQYATTGTLRVAEPLNAVVENIIHPRSMNVFDHDLVPGSFIGLILIYGWIAWLLGMWVVPFLTPLVATFGAVAFFSIVRFFFSDRVARWSFFILLLHPAYVYYSSRSLLSANVFFISMLMIGVAVLLTHHERWTAWAIGGVSIGASLIARTTEAGWVLGVFFLVILYFRQRIHVRHLFIFFFAVIFAFLPVLAHQALLYGHALTTGYAQGGESIVPLISPWRFSSPVRAIISAFVLPFGFDAANILKNAYEYLVLLFWWLTIPALLGIVIMIRKNERTRERKNSSSVSWFIGSFVFIALWLVVYYGSSTFRDSPLPSPTIGTAYVRYWLPLFVLSIPFMAIAFQSITTRWFQTCVVTACALFSIASTFVLTQESLWWMRASTRKQRVIAVEILTIVPSNGVILTESSDKLFFPSRRVMQFDPKEQLKIERLLARVAERVPVYFYTSLAPRGIEYLNTRHLAKYGVAWEDAKKIGALTLYKLQRQ
ncbi:glycosyltransferase family 39 protein [Candidatus Uhrbacteria bacterium]|nr:glycosyltransferase family 39 protein [Candidatus Uhrbacteria bacterium]